MADPISTAIAAVKTAATFAGKAAATKAGTAALTGAGVAAGGALASSLLTPEGPDLPKVAELPDPEDPVRRAEQRRKNAIKAAEGSSVNTSYTKTNLG